MTSINQWVKMERPENDSEDDGWYDIQREEYEWDGSWDNAVIALEESE